VSDLPPIPRRAQPPLTLPRPLLIGWALWLLISWAINLYLDGPPMLLGDAPFSRSHEAFVPAIQWMMVSAWLGLAVIWPAFRLSQTAPTQPTRHTLIDLISLLAVLFIVAATLMLVVGWRPIQVGVLMLAFIAYSLWIAAWVDIGLRFTAAGRTVMMIFCIATAAGAWLWPGDEERLLTLMFTPARMLRVLSRSVAPLDLPDALSASAVIAAGGMAVWVIGIYATCLRRGTAGRF
jgi:hypothetical protein